MFEGSDQEDSGIWNSGLETWVTKKAEEDGEKISDGLKKKFLIAEIIILKKADSATYNSSCGFKFNPWKMEFILSFRTRWGQKWRWIDLIEQK